jgi:hypothetical protein
LVHPVSRGEVRVLERMEMVQQPIGSQQKGVVEKKNFFANFFIFIFLFFSLDYFY